MLNHKSQITTPNIQNSKYNHLFCVLRFRCCVLFVICILSIVIYGNLYALDLDTLKTYFLNQDYKAAITEGERLIALADHSYNVDELYYILALSYLKDGNLLRASDIFEIILNEFKDSRFKDEAKLGLGDVYFLKGDFPKAKEYYQKVLDDNPDTKLKAQIYYRLSQVSFKQGELEQGNEYLNKLREEYPLNTELRMNKDLAVLPPAKGEADFYYSVQVGVFSNEQNALNLRDKLTAAGYDTSIQEITLEEKKNYRVKVGKLKSRLEAVELEKKLSSEGYPTKIFP